MNKVNPFQGKVIEFHILQSFPVTCLNRDDVGAPKTAVVGGVTRARVSSQCWKRQVRLALHDFGVKLAVRTKHVADIETELCKKLGASEEDAKACGEAIAKALTKDTLHFYTDTEARAFADYAKKLDFKAGDIKDKEIQKLAKKVFNPAVDGLDIALFGRMVAQATDVDLNVEAAASFSHAISTHKEVSEVEFFTALDDEETGRGSGHMGSLEFNSATYYRYVSLDLGQLYENLKGESMAEAVSAFVKALFVAVPAARQTTQSGACGWDYARVLVRKGQRVQLSFDKPVKSKGSGYLEPSIEALNEGLAAKKKMAGSLFGELADYTISENSEMNIDGLVDALVKFTEVEHA
jgi:CRISPR system Cascade subunit CasC